MNILITGASGKLGRILMAELIKDNQNKIVVLTKRGGAFAGLSEKQIFIADLVDMSSLQKIMKKMGQIDIVLHLAAITHADERKIYFENNVEGTRNLLQASENIGVKKFIFLSSRTACTGGGDYAESKIRAEHEVAKSNLDWRILALGEVYEKNGQDEINKLEKIIQCLPIIPVIGTGDYKMAPLDINDAIKVIIDTLKKDHLGGKRFVICGAESLRYEDLIKFLIKKSGKKRIIIHVPLPFVKLAFWLMSILRIKFFSYDQLSRLLVDKPADISETQKEYKFNPKRMADFF